MALIWLRWRAQNKTMTLKNRSRAYGELAIMYEGRLPI